MAIILTADIGGTNCRFARFAIEAGNLFLEEEKWISTALISDTDGLLDNLEAQLSCSLKQADAVVIAMAGQVIGEHQCRLANGTLECNLDICKKKADLPPCRLINDFVAEAYSIFTPAGAHATLISSNTAATSPTAPRALLGPGTGLGCSAVHHVPNFGWQVTPSEAGHSLFPFQGEEEGKYHAFLQRELKSTAITWEHVLAGNGLEYLHHFLCGQKISARDIGANVLKTDSPTRQWYATFLGRMARNWVLTTLCTGGLWFSGGVAVRNPEVFESSSFWNEMLRPGQYEAMVRQVPVRLMNQTNSGLWGAAYAGRLLLQKRGKL